MASSAAKELKKKGKTKPKLVPTENKGPEALILPAKELAGNLSFEYNCRSPSRGSRAYKQMRITIAEEPSTFLSRNSGITIANGKYVLDGGHTYLAIKDAKEAGEDLSSVSVKVVRHNGLRNDEMVVISRGLNTQVTPPLRGERDLKGDWDLIKEALDTKYFDLFEFRPHTKPGAPYKVDFLVALLHAVSGAAGEKAYSNKGLIVRLFNAEKYQPYLDLLNESIELYSLIAKDLSKHQRVQRMTGVNKSRELRLPNGDAIKPFVPDAYIFPLFCAFANLLDENVAWKKDPTKAWNEAKEKMITQLIADYRAHGKVPGKIGRMRDVYQNATVSLLSSNLS